MATAPERRRPERGGARAALGAVVAVVAVLAVMVLVAVLVADDPPDDEGSTEAATFGTSAGADAGTRGDDRPGASAPDTAPVVTSPAQVASWEAALAALVVAPEGSREGYDRDRFAHWSDLDGDGCDTRCEVLALQRVPSLPGLPRGGWLSLYDGYSTDDPSELDIDHVVSMAEAWESGASEWNDTRRGAFANDVDGGQLVAVTAATNRSKSDRDPADWQPPNRDGWCHFATAWVRVKDRWVLTADRREVDALRNILRGCP